MKVISRIAIVAVVALVVAISAQPASAFCPDALLILGCVGGSCTYISSPGLATTGAGGSLQGNFWGLGGGNPTVGQGDDNGSIGPNGNADPPNEDWIKEYAGAEYIAGSWGIAGVDGCINDPTTPAPKRTVIAISDQDAAGHGFWGLLCKEQDPTSGGFDVALLGTPVLGPIPYPKVLNSSRVAGVSVSVTVGDAGPDVSSAFIKADPSCTGLITGYRLYQQTRPNASGEPTDRARSAWNAVGPAIPLGQASPLVTLPCTADTSVYLATSLVYNTGPAGSFESAVVGEHRRIPCDGSIADRPGNFKIIKKPPVEDRRR